MRPRVVGLWSEEQIRAWTNRRLRGGPLTSLGKVHQGDLNQRIQLAAVDLLGPHATAWEGDHLDRTVKGMLRSRANTIEGGTTEVNKNVIGERLLGLPREPDPYKGMAWQDVPRS
jgi:alkylation response protein AidB-like acyl-CoA dehydrogenase